MSKTTMGTFRVGRIDTRWGGNRRPLYRVEDDRYLGMVLSNDGPGTLGPMSWEEIRSYGWTRDVYVPVLGVL